MPDIFNPEVISRIKGLELRSKRLVESYMVGIHKSRLLGISTEFAQHRQYVFGDDTRHIDWKVYAKTDEFFIKEYEAETNMAVYFLIDVSPSMFFKSEEAHLSKYEYAATMAATLSYMLMLQKDLFSLTLFDDKIQSFLKPKGSGLHFRNITDVLSKTEQEREPSEDKGTTDIGNAIQKLAPQIKKKGVVVIISDFIDDIEKLGFSLGQVSSLGQDGILLHIEDPIERDFPFTGQTILRGLEQEGKLLCDPRDLRNIYLRERAKHHQQIMEFCMKFAYSVINFSTNTQMDTILTDFLYARMSQRRRRR